MAVVREFNTRFAQEWFNFCARNGYKSIKEAVTKCHNLKQYSGANMTAISKFKSGARKLSGASLVLFSELFGCTASYLSYKSAYRTSEDELNAMLDDEVKRRAVYLAAKQIVNRELNEEIFNAKAYKIISDFIEFECSKI